MLDEHYAKHVSGGDHRASAELRPSYVETLTPTQLRVLRGVHLGLANKQIAFHLGIAEATVKAHMTALMRKLNVRNRTQVAILAEKFVESPSNTADSAIYSVN